MAKSINGGEAYDVATPGWIALCSADIRAGKPCSIVVATDSIIDAAMAVQKKVSEVAKLPIVGAVVGAVESGLGIPVPALPIDPLTIVEVLAGSGAALGALAAPAAVAAVAHVHSGYEVDLCTSITGALRGKPRVEIALSPPAK